MERFNVLIERLKKHVKVCFDGHHPQIDDNENAESDGDELLRLLTGNRDIGDFLFYHEDGKRASAVAAWVRQSPIIRPAYLAATTAKRQKAAPQWFVDRFARAFRPLRNNIFAYNLSNYHRDNRFFILFSEKVCQDAQRMWSGTKRLRARFHIRNALRVTYILLKAYERAKERLYAPGGAGAVAAKLEFEAAAKRQRLE